MLISQNFRELNKITIRQIRLISKAIQAANGYLYVACSNLIYIYDETNFKNVGNFSLQQAPLHNSEEDTLTIVHKSVIRVYDIQRCQFYDDSYTHCLLCSDGLYPDLYSSQCLHCTTIQNCLECLTTNSQCVKCQDGFYLDTQAGGCLSCSFLKNCITCSTNSRRCFSCEDGFSPSSETGQCQSIPLTPLTYILIGCLGAIAVSALVIGTIAYLKIKRKGCFAQNNEENQGPERVKKAMSPGKEKKEKKTMVATEQKKVTEKKPSRDKDQSLQSNQVLNKVFDKL